jgi:hypothetical protein
MRWATSIILLECQNYFKASIYYKDMDHSVSLGQLTETMPYTCRGSGFGVTWSSTDTISFSCSRVGCHLGISVGLRWIRGRINPPLAVDLWFYSLNNSWAKIELNLLLFRIPQLKLRSSHLFILRVKNLTTKLFKKRKEMDHMSHFCILVFGFHIG